MFAWPQQLKQRWLDWQERREVARAMPNTHWGYTPMRRQSAIKEVGLDLPLLAVVLALIAWGMVMVYSTTLAYPTMAIYKGFKPYHFIHNHMLFIAIALMAGTVAFFIKTEWIEKSSYYLIAITFILLVLVLLVGDNTKGSQRWLNLKLFSIQPSEILKLVTILAASNYIARRYEVVQTTIIKAVAPTAAYLTVMGVLLMLQPDLGSLMVVAVIAFAILFLGGLQLRMIVVAGLSVMAILSIFLVITPWRAERVLAFLDPWAPEHAMNKAYQLTNSMIGMGQGGIFGVGLGDSLEKLQWLPEAHTDYIFSILAEELGLLGSWGFIALFAWMIHRSFFIGRRAIMLDRLYAGMVAQGVAAWLGFQALFNLAVTMGVVPTKGLTLPFISFGGSAMVVSVVAMALVLRIDHDNRQLMRGRGNA